MEVYTDVKSDYNLTRIILISVIAAIGGFLFGFDSGVINGTIDGLQKAFSSNNVGTGFNVASMLLGCAIGAFFAGRLADKYGRRSLLIVASILFIISAWGSGIASSSAMFIFVRIMGGLAVGAASVMAPAYISEIAPSHIRGRLTTIQQIAIITGLFSAFVCNYVLAKSAGTSTAEFWLGYEAWRWMFWVELVPATIFFLALLFIPESPRFLVSIGRIEDATLVLKQIYDYASAIKKVSEIKQSFASDHRPSFNDLMDISTKKVRKIVWVGIGLATFQQLIGINVVFYYGAVLWQAAGFSEADALLINVISGGVSIGACIITIFLVDKIGRKPLLLTGSIGMACTLALLSFAFFTGTLDENSNLLLSDKMGLLALICANIYVFFFNISWGPVMWIMLGEMFPNQIRGSGLAVSGLFQWGANFTITMTFPIMLAIIGLAGAYGIYAFFALISIIFVLKYAHETRGIELEEMKG
jgi:MFS transporter, SP family, sugar:H+ symporter